MTGIDVSALIADRRAEIVAHVDIDGAAGFTLGYVSQALRVLIERYPTDRDVIEIATAVQAYREVVGLTDRPVI